MKIEQLLKAIQSGNIISSELPATMEITNITQDTRQVAAGSCFVCVEGATVDGHQFVDEAIQKGASLIISQKPFAHSLSVPVIQVPDTKKALAKLSVAFYGDPTKKLKVVGVTGTNGKTTTTHMIAEVMEQLGHQTGIIGTMYNKIGAQKLPTINTTPDSLTLQRLLKEMNEAEVTHCAMEVSSHALVQGRVWGVDFDVAVFTNLSQDHLEYHHTMQEYFYAKSLLFSQLGNTYHEEQKRKTAIINIDDSYGAKLPALTAANVLTYGTKGNGMIQAQNIEVSAQGTAFDLVFLGKTYPVRLKMIGLFNVYNALAAFASCYALGSEPKEIIQALAKTNGVKGRFELVPNDKEVTVIVDYAHTPDGLLNVLTTAQQFAKQEIYCVVGCGGDRDPSKRSVMADIAVEKATKPIFTSDNPRTEDPEKILDEMTSHLQSNQYQRIADRRQAIETALKQAQAGDVVLIAGKGHEDYQIIGTEKHHFDDVEVVTEFFEKND